MSGYAYRSPELHDLIEAGLPFLEKPFSTEGLRRKVHEVLGSPEERPSLMPVKPFILIIDDERHIAASWRTCSGLPAFAQKRPREP